MLKEGDKAPDFTLQGIDEEGKVRTFSLADLLDSALVLYFYPKDNTSGCTQEALDFKEHLESFKELGVKVVGISPDSFKSHLKFKEKYGLNFILLSDPEKEVAKKYFAYGKKKMYGKEVEGIIRSTFIIDRKGLVRACWYNVKVKGHVEEVLKRLKELDLSS